jgi:hypothetical protein
MLRKLLLPALVAVTAVSLLGNAWTYFHDPRTTAKKLYGGLEIADVGVFRFDYKAHHFNGPMFLQAKASDRFMNFLNAEVWGRMGNASLDFPVHTDQVEIPAGKYEFGVNMTKAEDFSVVLWKGKEKINIPLEVEQLSPELPYLNITIMATEDVDTYVLEARCGPFRGVADMIVPALDPDHEHGHEGEHGGEHGHEHEGEHSGKKGTR